MSKPLCDFCNKPSVAWCYPASDFVFEHEGTCTHVEMESYSGWTACENCHNAIEHAGVYGSVLQTVQSMGGYKVTPNIVMMIKALHTQFFANRTGPATPHKEKQCL